MNVNLASRNDDNAQKRETLLVSWLAGCARGETEGFRKIYETFSPQLFGLLLRILQRRDLAEDVLQDTFLNIWRKASEYRPDRGKVATWVFAIARHRALDTLRRRRERPLDPGTLMSLIDNQDAERQKDDELLHDVTEYQRLQECLAALSEQQRSSVTMAYLRGLTQEEIALHHKAPLGTVKSWVRRALIRLKRCLEQ